MQFKLNPDNSIEELMSTIQYVHENKITNVIANLKYLLNHTDEKTHEMALKTVMDLKGLEY